MRRATFVLYLMLSSATFGQTISSLDQGHLWDASTPVPAATELAPLAGVQFHVIKRRETDLDGYNWLHGVALAWHNDRLFASFGHNNGDENTASEVANYCVSEDGGRTWEDVALIDAGDEPDLAVSHGVFLRHDERLWAFHGAFTGRMKQIHTRAYILDGGDKSWRKLGVVAADGFWPMQEPQPMEDGNWIMAGLIVDEGIGRSNNPAGVAISDGDDFTEWNVVRIPRPHAIDMWGESTVIVRGSHVLNISRYRKPAALFSISADFGRTWSPIGESNLPMAASKPYAGRLSTGQHYLIGSIAADNGNRRWPLSIIVSQYGEEPFSRAFRIRDAEHDAAIESHPRAALSYPYAIEHDGKLYVGYSNDGGRGSNRNTAEMAIIPLESLTR